MPSRHVWRHVEGNLHMCFAQAFTVKIPNIFGKLPVYDAAVSSNMQKCSSFEPLRFYALLVRLEREEK